MNIRRKKRKYSSIGVSRIKITKSYDFSENKARGGGWAPLVIHRQDLKGGEEKKVERSFLRVEGGST